MENTVKLSDGRLVELREATGSDEMIVAANLGETFMPGSAGSVIFSSCLVAQNVVSIDGTKTQPLRSYEEYRNFMDKFKRKDWNKIRELYYKVNGDLEGNESEGK